MILDGREGAYVTRFIELARTFPSILDIDDAFRVWELDGTGDRTGALDIEELDAWACSFAGSGGREAAAFLLNLWSSRHPWKSGRHELRQAWGAWDVNHRCAWLAWAREPWWP